MGCKRNTGMGLTIMSFFFNSLVKFQNLRFIVSSLNHLSF